MDAAHLRHIITRLRRHRRPVAAGLAFLAVLCALTALRPAPPSTVSVLVAATDLPWGTALTPERLNTVSIPESYAVPGAITDPSTVNRRLLAAPMRAGEVLTDSRLAAPPRADGTLAVPVRLADADVAALLAPGMRLDIVAVGRSGDASVVAEQVRLITIPEGTTGSLLLVAADRATAIRLAAASSQGDLSAILR